MAERPIIFSAPMVRALLDGRKTQTRRILKAQPPAGYSFLGIYGPRLTAVFTSEPTGIKDIPVALPYSVGDRLWVKEDFRVTEGGVILDGAGGQMDYVEPEIIYRADSRKETGRWKPSIYMPRWASRITLEVTEVRVQRLQEISESDARAEGISPLPSGRFFCGHDEEGEITCNSPITAFAWLWNSLHENGSWDTNPWICAISFRRL